MAIEIVNERQAMPMQSSFTKRCVVLHLIESFDQGGSERQALQLAGLLKRDAAYDVRIATIKSGGMLQEIAASLGFVDTPNYPLSSFYDTTFIKSGKRLAEDMRSSGVDIIQTHDFYTNILGMFAARMAKVPVRIASRRDMGDVRSPAQNWLERRAYRLANCTVANCDAIRNKLIAEGMSGEKVVTIRNSIDLQRVKVTTGLSRTDALRQLNLDVAEGAKLVTMVANFRLKAKDHPTLIQAARIVRERVPSVVFVLAGEGPLRVKMEALSRELGIEATVRFLGRCDRLAELLFVSDVCVLSSTSEGLPNVVLEYMAAAKPVVATDVGGVGEAVADGETGYLVKAGDVANMAGRIVELLLDRDKACEMGWTGRRKVEEQFLPQVQLDSVRQLYARLRQGCTSLRT